MLDYIGVKPKKNMHITNAKHGGVAQLDERPSAAGGRISAGANQ